MEAANNVSIAVGGVTTGGGNFTSSGNDYSQDNAAVMTTNGGNVKLWHSGNVLIQLTGFDLGMGGFYSTGANFTYNNADFTSTMGSIDLDHTGDVSFAGSAHIFTNGGNFTSRGVNFLWTMAGAGLFPGGGNILLLHTGDVTLGGSDTGFDTEGGSIEIHACQGMVTVGHNNHYFFTDGGQVAIYATFGNIELNTVLNTFGGGSPGNVIINSRTGSDIVINADPNTGGNGGDVILDTTLEGSQFCEDIIAVPTLGQWGLICLGLLLLIVGIVRVKNRSALKLNFQQ